MPGKRKPIGEAWEGFCKAAMPVGVGDVQRTEMKKAFYAGAFSLFKILMIETADGEDEPTEANIDMMKDVEADIKNYMATILRD